MSDGLEEWRFIPGYGDWYEVSDLGRVRSWRGRGGGRVHRAEIPCVLAGCLRRRATAAGCVPGLNYRGFTLMGEDGKATQRAVGPIVLLAFVGQPPSPLHECGHRNGTSTDDRLENLEWRTPQGHANSRAARGTTARGESSGVVVLTDAEVEAIRYRYAKGDIGTRPLAKQWGVSASSVRSITTGESRATAGGPVSPRRKQRSARGLTDDQVRHAREAGKEGISSERIAAGLPVSPTAIRKLLRGESYRDVT